jgi:hypothetical protein
MSELKKRKLDGDVETEEPRKRLKTSQGKKPGRHGAEEEMDEGVGVSKPVDNWHKDRD